MMPYNDEISALSEDAPIGLNPLHLNATMKRFDRSQHAPSLRTPVLGNSLSMTQGKRSRDDEPLMRNNRPRLNDKLDSETKEEMPESEVSSMLKENFPPDLSNPLHLNEEYERNKKRQNQLHAINGHSSSSD